MSDIEKVGRKALSTLPGPLKRGLDGTNLQFISAPPERGSRNLPAIASVADNSPDTIQVSDPQRFTQGAPQVLAHEATHLWQNNLPPKLQQMIPPDNLQNPYDFGGAAGLKTMRAQGKRLLDLPREKEASILQHSMVDKDPAYKPWIEDMNSIPLSQIMPTKPGQQGIETTPRPPRPPATMYADQLVGKGTPPIDYDALAKQYGGVVHTGTGGVDYDALAQQYGGTVVSDAQSAPAGTPGGVLPSLIQRGQNLFDKLTTVTPEQEKGHSGLFNRAQEFGAGAIQGAGMPFVHPEDTAVGIGHMIAHPVDTAEATGSQFLSHPAQAVGNLVGGSVLAGAAGEGAGNLIAKIPTRAKAGALLNQVQDAAGSRPVNFTRTTPALEEAQRLSDWGHGTVTPLDSLYKRMNTVNPVDYTEARGRYSPLTSLTASDRMNATPKLQSAAKQVAHAMRADIGDTAESVGMRPQYDKGMNMYRSAARNSKIAKDIGTKYLPGAAGAYEGYRLFKGR